MLGHYIEKNWNICLNFKNDIHVWQHDFEFEKELWYARKNASAVKETSNVLCITYSMH